MNEISAINSNLINTKHGFFTRHGGVSTGIYASLNASYGSNDTRANIDENRTRIANFFDVPVMNLLTLNQTHSNICITVEKPYDSSKSQNADALATNVKGLAIGVLTADCVPILLEDPQAKVIGAAHAGWKGAIAGIIEATISSMQQLGANPQNINAAIGPSIAQCSYEVENSFADDYLKQNPNWQKFFTKSIQNPTTHLLFDNKQFTFDKLLNLGVNNIELMPHDTYAQENDFFSFRRATHNSEADYGRQISVIML